LELELGMMLVERRDATQGAVLRAWLQSRVLPAFEDRVPPVDTAVADAVLDFTFPIPARSGSP
jgi:hypothetical protein